MIAGESSSSPLIELVTSDDESVRMPPTGEPLSATEIKTLAKWIDEGAVWPASADQAQAEDRRDHWSFKPLAARNLHAVRELEGSEVQGAEESTSWPFTPCIDHFINARLAEKGLDKNPPADPQSLVRRIYLDLTGLPPTPDEVVAFVREPDVARLVDRVLASPRYGERWAQHWLDVIRWAETVGFETNAERRNAWPYRDWVIASLNADKPYDRFVFEQIAGDTVGEDAALGFLVAGPANLPGQVGRDEAAMRGSRQDELDEVISTVSQAFLGLTVACARCHDHKFDPILQSDYYSLQAIFAGLSYGSRRWRGPQNDTWAAQIPAARDEVKSLRTELESLRRQYDLRKPIADVHTETFEPVLASAVRMRIAATVDGSPASLYEFEAWSKPVGKSGQSVNVALASLGATPSASSFALANQSRHFDNLIDGSIDQRQAYPWVSAETGPAWFQIDFKEPAAIDRVTLHRGSGMPADFVIEVLTSEVGSQYPESSQENGPDAGGRLVPCWREIAHTRDRLPRVDDTRRIDSVKLAPLVAEETQRILDLLGDIRRAESRLARLSAGPQVYAASFTPDPHITYRLHRGDAMQRREKVGPGIPEFLGTLNLPPGASETEGRLALAHHLTRSDHPLTARVIVNRVWQHHFGVGLVNTPSDFGRMGTAPSHPELLDWLAAKFVVDGWSLKKLHHLILTSETYQQSSVPRADALAIDADSRLLWRYPPRRLEAEVIRDSILGVSGKLNLKSGGPGFDFFNQRGGLADYEPKETFDEEGWRRMIYAHKVRMVSVAIFGAFDCPDAGQMKPSRTSSITPVQSLGLFNSPFVIRQAAFFAERLRSEVGHDPTAQVDRAFQLAYSRGPTHAERIRLMALAERHGLEAVCRVILNTSEFAYIQ